MNAPVPISRRLVVVEVDGNAETIVTAPYTARPIIKALYWPLRRWDPQRCAWVVKDAGVRTLIADLRANGFEVDIWESGRMRTLPATSDRRRP